MPDPIIRLNAARTAAISRRFTGRDGVEWRIEWKAGQIAMAVPRDLDVQKVPQPPGGLHFESGDFAFVMKISEIDPNQLTEPELQGMIDEHTVH